MKIKKQFTAIMSIDEFNSLINDTEYHVFVDSDGWWFGIDTEFQKVKKSVSDIVNKLITEKYVEEDVAIETVLLEFIAQKITGNYNAMFVDEKQDVVILVGD